MWTFQHQRVYDPTGEEIVHLSDIPSDIGEDLDFLGPWLSPNVVKGIAEGDLDPFTKLPFQVRGTHTEVMLDKPYSVKEFVLASGRKMLNLPVQNNVLTNYFCLASLEAKQKFRAPKVMPKCTKATESTSPDSESCESDSAGSTDDATPTINHQKSSLLSKYNIDDLSPKDSLILHPEQLRASKIAPKYTMESLSPGSNSQESNSTISASDGTPTISHQECSLLLPRDSGYDHRSKNSMEGGFSNDSNKPAKLHLQGNTVTSPNSHSLMELANISLRPFLTSHKEQGCKTTLDATRQGSCGLDGDKRNTKSLARKVTKRNPYFLNRAPDKNDPNIQKEEQLVHKEADEGTGDHPVAAAASIRNGCQERAMKKRKLLHAHNLQSESQPERNLHITSVEEGDHIPNLNKKCTNGEVEGNFGCDVSHLKKYSGIAEKSVERFASLVSSFRYNSSGSRASGLRPPLKDIQNTCPVRSTVGPIDFSKFAYKPKNKSV